MKFHIVRNEETLNDVITIYSLTIDELKESNRHIRDWNKLIPGTKLKIPIINEAVEQDIIDMEPFIEDYYPRNDEPLFNEEEELTEGVIKEELNTKELKEEKESIENKEEKEIKKENREETPKENKAKNISYIWYQPYPVYYPIYIKVK